MTDGLKMGREFEPGSSRDRCSHCGGWISMGHAKGSDCRRDAEDSALRDIMSDTRDPNELRRQRGW